MIRAESPESQPWGTPPDELSLEGDAVHLWHVYPLIPAGGDWELLSPDERGAADRFRFPLHRDRYVACRARLRRILARYTGRPADGLVFRYGPFGKPSLDDANADWRFNVSHAHDHALIGVARGREVGVDIECLGADAETLRAVERFLTSGEIDRLRAAGPELRPDALLACWTRKEAWAKAIGCGLSQPPGRFDVSAAMNRPAAVLADPFNEGDPWTLHALRPTVDTIGALAARGDGPVVRYRA